jgi:Prokaryotic metallothionein
METLQETEFQPKNPMMKCARAGCSNMVPYAMGKNKRLENRYCSRVCASQRNYNKRYGGSMSGPADRPREDKVKFT